MLRDRRGVSEVLGVIIIAAITIAASVAYVTMSAGRLGSETMSLADLIKVAERRQSQLLSLTYYYKHGDELKLYVYNYGEEASTPKLILVDQDMVFWRAQWLFEWFEVSDSSGRFGSKLGESAYTGESYSFNWGDGEVYDWRGDRVGYSARTQIYFKDSSTITIGTDDGMEVYIDGQPVFNGMAWHLQAPTTYQKTVSLSPGNHDVSIKWYEWGGLAYSSFSATNVVPHLLSMKNMNIAGNPLCEAIPSKTLVEITLPAPASSTFDLTLLTEQGAVYSWKLTV